MRPIRIDNIVVKRKDGAKQVVEVVRKPRDASQAAAWRKGKKQRPVRRVV